MYLYNIKYTMPGFSDCSYLAYGKDEREAMQCFINFLPCFEDGRILPLTIYSITLFDTI